MLVIEFKVIKLYCAQLQDTMVYKYKSYVCCHKMAFFLQGTDKFFGKVSKQNKNGFI